MILEVTSRRAQWRWLTSCWTTVDLTLSCTSRAADRANRRSASISIERRNLAWGTLLHCVEVYFFLIATVWANLEHVCSYHLVGTIYCFSMVRYLYFFMVNFSSSLHCPYKQQLCFASLYAIQALLNFCSLILVLITVCAGSPQALKRHLKSDGTESFTARTVGHPVLSKHRDQFIVKWTTSVCLSICYSVTLKRKDWDRRHMCSESGSLEDGNGTLFSRNKKICNPNLTPQWREHKVR